MLEVIRSLPAYQQVLQSLAQRTALPGLGLPRAARLAVMAALQGDLNLPVLLLTDRADHALTLLDELGFWAAHTPRRLFPEPNPLFYEPANWGSTTRRDRLQALTTLALYHMMGVPKPETPGVIVAPVRAVMARTLPRRDFLKVSRTLKVGQQVAPEALQRAWVEIGYQSADLVVEPGQFSRRGGILDIWPAAETGPVRLDFFGDEIDTCRRFEPGSQRTIQSVDQVLITPAREFLLAKAAGLNLEGQELSEFHLPLLHPAVASLLDYLPQNALVIVDDLDRLQIAAGEIEEQSVRLRQDSIKEGLLPPDFPVPYLSWSELQDSLAGHAWIELGRTTAGEESPLAAAFSPGPRFAGRLKPFVDHLVALTERGEEGLAQRREDAKEAREEEGKGEEGLSLRREGAKRARGEEEKSEEGLALRREDAKGAQGEEEKDEEGLALRREGAKGAQGEEGFAQRREDAKIVIVSRQVARLEELWRETRPPEGGPRPQFVDGTLSEGWVLTLADGGTLHLLTDSEIFGWERPRPRQAHQPTAELPEAFYADLKPGDWVVHIDYGIGRYEGLVRRSLEGMEREFLAVSYAEGDQLFVPVHQADRLGRYIGPDAGEPTLTRLGTPDWTNTKQRVREAVLEIAQELLELYAKRQVAVGHAFQPDSTWQQELEASFPYIETQDQLAAIRSVKRDMESPRPMDRLLCGDVGYGKTEVALRAAFKAVMDGKQVAILVPTTVLAQQHFETFRQRLAPFPANVEMLSRFRTPREQDEIIKRLQAGQVDIIIGTHRLIQPDVVFKDLGLVIIDEEQRFGVTHKEHFKKLRTEIDVLTLTATPIPRTLYMALTGVRDISTINTPPEERLPIITHIGPYSPRLVRQAILREQERGGQVFFVHNRVQTIRAMERHLNQLVPEARVGVGHGQMHESALSEVMQKFTHGDIDVLLCTSIIESGLDIPNANTLIVDRGDTFGLAQLYQLRGRVGRGAQRAYAYFFRHRKKAPTPEGAERLEVIAENTKLGAGYSIAMRDLEMRGAGELLGNRQHGFIASVGFQLYTRLLAQAVRQLRQVSGLPAPKESLAALKEIRPPVNVDLPIQSGIPLDYVPDQAMRLQLYRRLADLHDEGEAQAIAEEFSDRFGPLPLQVINLIYQMRVKLLADHAGLAAVSVESEQIVLRYPPLPDNVPARSLPILGYPVRSGKNAYWMPLGSDEADWKARLIDALADLAGRD